MAYFARSFVALDPERMLALPIDGLLAALVLSTVIYTGLLRRRLPGLCPSPRAAGHPGRARPRR
jgi:hypothetical protein